MVGSIVVRFNCMLLLLFYFHTIRLQQRSNSADEWHCGFSEIRRKGGDML